MPPRPLFVVCPPRSGSTLAIALLDSHPRIAMTNEAAWITFLRKAFLLASTPSSQWVDDGECLRTPGILPEKYTRNVAEAFVAVMRPFVAGVFERTAGPGDRAFYGDKILSCHDLAFAIEWLPESAFVQLVRDPRDMIASTFAFQNKQPAAWQHSTFETRVDHMRTFLRDSSAMLAGRDSFLLRYEDLVADVEACSQKVFQFLKLEMAPEVRDYLRGAAKGLFASHGTSTSPQSSIGRWRQDLTPTEQALANEQLGDVLQQFGYEI